MNKVYRFMPLPHSIHFGVTYHYLNMLIATVMLLLVNNASFAATPNPGATCPAGAAQGSFVSSDYNNLVASSSNNNYFNVAGNASGSIPLQMKMTVTESSINNINDTFSAVNNSVVVGRNFPSANDYTDLTLNFRNSTTQQPIYLTNVAMSAFDVDYSNNGSSLFDDYVRITGVTQNGSIIDGTLQNIAGSNVAYPGGLNNTTTFNCASRDLDTRCQGSIQFSQAVSTVTVRYTNNTNFITSNPTSQEIQLRVDNYCYVPPPSSYSITKDDGINSVGTNNTTTYIIKVTNTGETALTNIVLKDPVATGLIKENNVTCDATDNTNTCITAPTKTQLESTNGFTIPSLAVGRTYSIKVPTKVTASEGSTVTNTATIKTSNLDLKSASDSNSVGSVFSGGSSNTPATCPSGHKMYYLGANPPSFSPINSQPLDWTTGNLSRTFTFAESTGNKTFIISFDNLRNLNSSGGTPPYFGSINGVTTSAINLRHNSPSAETNHELNIRVNRPVSKTGYKVQDLDSTIISGEIPYVEQVDVSTNGGLLTFNEIFHTINSNRNIVTAIRERNCGVGECTIDATWGYNTTNTPLNLKHSNTFTERNSTHVVGYSDFYFCLAPPKVVINKALTGTRVNDTAGNRDQFTISVNNSGTPLSSFETIGSGQNITNNSGAITLAENTTYTITERVTSSAAGDIANYSATYACNNNTAGSNTVMPTSAMTYDPAAKTRSFTLSNVAYGDQVTCTITNSPASYTFSGIVFNDNGGITASSATQYDTSATFTSNANYANGLFDSNENGIFANGLQVRLTDCSGNILAASPSNPQTVSNTSSTLGRYNFNVSSSVLSGKTKVCLIEIEPSDWAYTVDTNMNTREVTLVANTYNYSTAKDTSGAIIRNLDFGELKPQNAPLVLKKYQYVHQCDDALDYTAVPSGTEQPTTGFSVNPASDIEPENCIAYKVEAYNRGHIELTDVQITDELQLTPVKSVFRLPSPLGVPASIYQGSNTSAVIGSNGTIVSDIFNLSKATTSNPTQATLYFNSKYGKTNVD